MDPSTSLLDLVQFACGGKTFSSAAISHSEKSTRYEDFITFLGIAQRHSVDFLPITWLPAIDVVGGSATAEIRQTLANYQVSFAFKRLTMKLLLQPLIAELQIMGHPAIQKHPNILRLEGISWDIDASGEVWPVFVFQKAHHIDLGRFIRGDIGRQMSFDDRLEMLADIASAVTTMHANGIVHGDLKPQNILVFSLENSSRRYVSKVADFGYSAIFAKENGGPAIRLPGTRGWCALEWYPGYAATDITAAKKLDAYSFGLLCAWLLFQITSSRAPGEFCDRLDETVPLAMADHLSSSDVSESTKHRLMDLFDTTLVREPARRCSDFGRILQLLSDKSFEIPVFEISSRRLSFEISSSLFQVYRCDYRVRVYIATCLHEIYKSCSDDATRAHIASELQFCYTLGFGVTRNSNKLCHLDAPAENLNMEVLRKIDNIKVKNGEVPDYQGLYNEMQSSIRSDSSHTYLEMGCVDQAIVHFQQEIQGVKESLAPDHSIVVDLTSELSLLFYFSRNLKEAEDLAVLVMGLRKKFFGQEDPRTLNSMLILAMTYDDQGRWDEAEALQVKVVEAAKRVWGQVHLSTLSCMGNLAQTYRNQGRWTEAEELQILTTETRKRVFGQEHPDTLTSMGDLALTYNQLGQDRKAEELNTLVMETTKKILGLEHPETLASMNNLAMTYRRQG